MTVMLKAVTVSGAARLHSAKLGALDFGLFDETASNFQAAVGHGG